MKWETALSFACTMNYPSETNAKWKIWFFTQQQGKTYLKPHFIVLQPQFAQLLGISIYTYLVPDKFVLVRRFEGLVWCYVWSRLEPHQTRPLLRSSSLPCVLLRQLASSIAPVAAFRVCQLRILGQARVLCLVNIKKLQRLMLSTHVMLELQRLENCFFLFITTSRITYKNKQKAVLIRWNLEWRFWIGNLSSLGGSIFMVCFGVACYITCPHHNQK